MIFVLAILSFTNTYAQDRNVTITNTNYKHSNARWSPVGDLILFDSDMEGKKSIYIVKPSGSNLKRLTSLDYEDWLASWSPDGGEIAYSSLRNNKYQIFIYDLASNTQRQLTTSPEFSAWGPAWSPDGKQIAYSSKLGGRNVREIFIIDVDGKNKKRLTHNKKINILPVFSADGKRIFYQSTAGSNDSSKPDIYSFHLPTSKIEQITDPNSGAGVDPFIYAPNKKLAFFGGSKTSDGFGTYWIDLETKKMTKFDIKAKSPGHPTWSHDGQYVTIVDRRDKEIHIYDIENSESIMVTDK